MANTPVEDLPGMATRPAVQMPRIYNSLVIKLRVSIWDENSVATPAHNLPATQEMRVQPLGQEDAPWRRKRQPASVFLSGKYHGWRSLVGYNSKDCKRIGRDLAT